MVLRDLARYRQDGGGEIARHPDLAGMVRRGQWLANYALR